MARKRSDPFFGEWRIVWMEQWDQDYVEAEGPAWIRFGKEGAGEFHFAYVYAELYWRPADERRVFTWEGNEEYDDVSGCGWAEVEQDEMRGCLYCHGGGADSWFRAARTPTRTR